MTPKEAAQAALELYRTSEVDLFCQVGRHSECMAPGCGCLCHGPDPFPTPEAVDDYLRERGYDPVQVGRRGPMLARNILEWERDREAKV